jgi:hypothetical protein
VEKNEKYLAVKSISRLVGEEILGGFEFGRRFGIWRSLS